MLPKVSKEIHGSMHKDFGGDHVGYLNDVFLRLKRENPFLAGFVNSYAANVARNKGESRRMLGCALFAYRMLESQDEADQLSEDGGSRAAFTFTRAEAKALYDVIDELSDSAIGGSARDGFAWDGTDDPNEPIISALVKMFKAADRPVPDNLQ
jgi:hypothetical protein